jgi:AsmA protein
MARPYRRLIRIIGFALAAMILLGIAAVAILVLFIDADTFRPRIERIATTQLGRDVSLGHLEWDLGWRLGLATEGGSIANAPGFEGEAIAGWKRIEFGLALRPLLRRQVQIDHLAIDGLVVDLQKDSAGVANWTLPARPEKASEGTTSIGIESVALTAARIRYRDAASQADWRIESFALEVDLPGGRIDQLNSLQELELGGQLHGGPLDAAGVAFSFTAGLLRFDRKASTFALPEFRAVFDASTLEGALDGGLGSPGGEALHATSELKLLVPSLRNQLTRLGIEMPPMRDPTTLGALSLSAQVAYDHGAASIVSLAMQMDDTQLSGTASAPSLSPLALRFDLEADRIDLDRYLEPQDFQGDPLTLPVARLKALDAKGFLSIANARVAGAEAAGVQIKVE